jgi:chromosomal replication initiator protein
VSDDDLPHAWRRIQHELRRAVGDSTWHIWLKPLTPRSHEAGVLVVEAPDAIRPWVGGRFSRVLRACTEAVLGPGVSIDLVGPGEGIMPSGPAPPPQGAVIAAGSAFNPRFTFDQFVIGDGNRLAHAAALAVAEMPGLAYNPLFICGPPGLGKTHLLHSIANYVRDHGGGMSVLYTTAEAFTDQFVGALRTGAIEAFKTAYRNVDVLLVDDVQFLQSKARTEQEFFHTFNALQGAGAQLVLTSDRLPRDMDALEDRLRDRFESGLVTDVRPPDVPTRLTVLRKRAQQDEIEIADDALETIAGRVDSNLRTLEGALIRVVAFASLTGREPTAGLAAEVLDDLYPRGRARSGIGAAGPTIELIQDATAETFGLTRAELLSHSRRANLAWPRQIAMYLAREHTAETLPAIAARFGGRNHTTVLHACRRAAERLAIDPEASEAVRLLTERLGVRVDDRRG